MTSAISEAMLVRALWMMLSVTVSIAIGNPLHPGRHSPVVTSLYTQLQETIRADDERVARMDDGRRIGLLDDRGPGQGEASPEQFSPVNGRFEIAPAAK